MKIRFLLILLLSAAFSAEVFAAPPDVNEVIRKNDELYRSKSSYAVMAMEIVTPNWQRTLEMKAWSEGMKKTFIRILAPKKDRGVATLRLGNEMWNYLPNVNKVIKIPPSMMMSSWMGSDFTNDDLVKESSMMDDYDFSYTKVENPELAMLYIELKPKENKPIVWDRIVLAVRESDYLPVWERYYDERGTLVRVMDFKDIRDLGGKRLPTVMELVPQNKKGHKTVIRYKDLKFDIPLESGVFTLRNLQSKE